MQAIRTAAIVVLLTTPALAQRSEHPGSWGHVFFAGGGTSGGVGFYHFGGGGGGLLTDGFGVSAELGAASAASRTEFIGIFTPGVFYAFNRDNRWSPFVGGGYSMGFRSSAVHGAYVNAGAHYWIDQKLGLRFEVRNHVWADGVALNLLEGRVSIVFH